MKKAEDIDAFSEVEHKHHDSVASLGYARVHKSVRYIYYDGISNYQSVIS